MLPSFRAKKQGGWMAVVPAGAHLDLAHVVRRPAGRPELRLLESYTAESGLPATLTRLRSARQLGKFRCTTLLREGDYRLMQVEAPDVPPAELAQALRWRLKDMVDFPVEAAAVDALAIPVETAGGGRAPNVFAVAAPRPVIADCMAAFHEARVPLEAIDIPEIALRNVVALFEEPNRGVAGLAFVADSGWLVITYGGELYLSRRIDVSAAALADAEPERRQMLLERVALELQRTLDTFDRQYGFISVVRLLVTAERPVEGLQPFLAENLFVPVQMLDLAEVLDSPAVPELADPVRQAQCLLAVGAALREGK